MSIKKAQSAIEFLILISGLFFFFLVFFMIMQNNIEIKNNEKNNLLIERIAYNIQEEINLAINARGGYSRVFYVPEKIGNREYNASIQEGMIYLITHDEKYAIAIPIKEINGDIQIGENIIEKKNKEVYLNDL